MRFPNAGGTSPLARGKPGRVLNRAGDIRNIPARAGKTLRKPERQPNRWEHPRSRGENPTLSPSSTSSSGTSPLARGKRITRRQTCLHSRNIPARAGKTSLFVNLFRQHGEHPRSRGENLELLGIDDADKGTSPLARGKPPRRSRWARSTRNIPARAGKTVSCPASPSGTQEHPRSRGENGSGGFFALLQQGTSPLARGKRSRSFRIKVKHRNIPARAGKTQCTSSRPSPSGGTSPLARGKQVP